MAISSESLTAKGGLDLLNKIFLSAGEGIIIVGERGKIQMANKRASELFGYSADEFVNKVVEDLIPSKFKKKHIKHREGYIKAPVSRPMGTGLDLVGLKKSGDTFPLEISLSHFEHEGMKLVVAFITDITQRKSQEMALAQSREQLQEHAKSLEFKVKERTQELEHLNLGLKSQIRERKLAEEALKDSLEEIKRGEKEIRKSLEKEKELNEMKSRFISMASHEFKTPLTTVLSSANLLSKYTTTEQQENRSKHIDRIKSSVQNLNNILNDFLSLEKLDGGYVNINKSTFDMEELLNEIKESFELTVKKGQQINFQVEAGLQVFSDPHLVQNIVINLISNAVKYSPEQKPIDVICNKVGENIEIKIIDQGIGIPQREQKNMFKRFYRAANAINIGGTGLGLNIVKRYLDLIDGHISFNSKEGEGSEIIIRFPVRK